MYTITLIASLPAAAQDLQWSTVSDTQTGTNWSVEATCDQGYTAISGTAQFLPEEHPTSALSATIPNGWGDWEGAWMQPLGIEEAEGGHADQIVGAFCAEDATHFDCLTHVVSETDLRPDALVDHTLVCPLGTYIVGGGASLVGDSEGVVFRAAAPTGLAWMIGYRAIAEVLDDGEHDDWGVRIEAWCADASVMSTIGVVQGAMSVDTSWDGLDLGVDYVSVGTGVNSELGTECDTPLLPGMAAFAPNVIGGMGWNEEGVWTYRVNKFERATDPSEAVTNLRAICTNDVDAFAAELEECPGGAEPDPENVFQAEVPSMGGTLLIGGSDGSAGLILVPGEGDVPIPNDYRRFSDAANALPVAVLAYTEGSLEGLTDLITDALDVEDTAWSEETDLSETLVAEGVVLVTPEDEQEAVDWLEDHRGDFADLEGAFVVVLLQAEGAALQSMQSW
ncbi:MAG: hypothetical protein KTR31_22260 [Myxococcales bacterium]|nr:hypothetical protein [Myxococcales bacterium]